MRIAVIVHGRGFSTLGLPHTPTWFTNRHVV
jgi:hypothetical protein